MGEAKRREDAGIADLTREIEVSGIERFGALRLAAQMPTKCDGAQRSELLDELEAGDPVWSWDDLGHGDDFPRERFDATSRVTMTKGSMRYLLELVEQADKAGMVGGDAMRKLRRVCAKVREAIDRKPASVVAPNGTEQKEGAA